MFFCLILTKICDRNINITCLFIVLVFEEKVNEILTYNQWRTYVQGIQGMPCPFGFGAPMLDT